MTINSGNAASTGYPSAPCPWPAGGRDRHPPLRHGQVAEHRQRLHPGRKRCPHASRHRRTDSGPRACHSTSAGKYLYVVATPRELIRTAIPWRRRRTRPAPVRPNQAAGTGPTCVSVIGAPQHPTPSHAEYMYVSNQLSQQRHRRADEPLDRRLEQIQGTPFSGSTLPTAWSPFRLCRCGNFSTPRAYPSATQAFERSWAAHRAARRRKRMNHRNRIGRSATAAASLGLSSASPPAPATMPSPTCT